MRTLALCLFVLGFCLACSDNAKTEVQEDVESETSTGPTVSGYVHFLDPLPGATVTISDWPDSTEPLGTAVTDNNGRFDLLLDSDPALGQVLLVSATTDVSAFSGRADNLSGVKLQALVIWPGNAELWSEIRVGPWSTLATALAQGLRARTQQGMLSLSKSECAGHAADLLSNHLSPGQTVNLILDRPLDPTAGQFNWPDEKAALSLANMGLVRLASLISETENVQLSPQALLAVIVEDATDGLLDGIRPTTLSGPAAWLTADTTRHDFAYAVYLALSEMAAPPVPWETLAERGGYFLSVSLDHSTMYPSDKPGKPFDPLLPTMTIEKLTSAEEICGPFNVIVRAEDNHKLVDLRLTADGQDVPLEIEFEDNQGSAEATGTVNPNTLEAASTLTLVATAEDTSGNIGTTESESPRNLAVPAIQQLAPSASDCLPEPPTNIEVAVESSSETEMVTIDSSGYLVECKELEESIWQCPYDSDSNGTIIATNLCGQSSSFKAQLCIDDIPPLIEMSFPTELCGIVSHEVVVSVSDNIKVKQVIISTSQGSEVFNDWTGAHIATIPLDGPTEWLEVKAYDTAGNESVGTFACVVDSTPPEAVDPASGQVRVFLPAPTITTQIKVQDTQSKVISGAAQATHGQWTLEVVASDTMELTGVLDPQFLDGLFFPVSYFLLDEYGNLSDELLLYIWIDGAGPAIKQIDTTVYDEAGIQPTYNQVTGELTVDMTDAPLITLNSDTCTESCPEFTKLAHRLVWDGESDFEANNIPVLAFEIEDICPGQFEDSIPLSVIVDFWSNDYLTNTLVHDLNCGSQTLYIPIHIGSISKKSPSEFAFKEYNIPNRVELTAIDSVGNFTGKSVPIQLLVEPVFPFQGTAESVGAEGLPSVVNTTNEATPDLHSLFAGNYALASKLLINPYDIPLSVKLAITPKETILLTKSRVYANPLPAALPTCETNQHCQYWTESFPAGVCELPLEFEGQALLDNDQLPTRTMISWPNGVVEPWEIWEEVSIPAHSSLGVHVVTDYSSTGVSLAPPVLLRAADGAKYPAYQVSDAQWSGICRTPDIYSAFSYDLPEVLITYATGNASNSKLTYMAMLNGSNLGYANNMLFSWFYIYIPEVEGWTKL